MLPLSRRAVASTQSVASAPDAAPTLSPPVSVEGERARVPSKRVQALAKELLALPPAELTLLRKACRERLIPKPSHHKGPLPKKYDPEIRMKRSDSPFPMRSKLRDVGDRISHLHPAWVFAGQGPGILAVPMPSITSAIMGPHSAELAQSIGPHVAAEVPAVADVASAEVAAVDEQPAEEVPVAETPKEEEQKATLSIKLVAFETSKKIAVVKEVRSMLGQGLKESKELVESAPKTLKKNVPRNEAEALAEKLRAAGAEVSLE